MQEQHTAKVYIVDDDQLVRASLEAMLAAAGYATEKFATASYFLTCITPAYVGCVLADYDMPGLDGIALQEELVRRGSPLSVIIMTGYGDVPLAVRAIKGGAIDFLEKPFDRQTLLASVATALAKSHETAIGLQERDAQQARWKALTRRERQVVELLMAGRTNRQVAEELCVSPRTVEIHRAHALEKLQAESLLDLVRINSDPQ